MPPKSPIGSEGSRAQKERGKLVCRKRERASKNTEVEVVGLPEASIVQSANVPVQNFDIGEREGGASASNATPSVTYTQVAVPSHSSCTEPREAQKDRGKLGFKKQRRPPKKMEEKLSVMEVAGMAEVPFIPCGTAGGQNSGYGHIQGGASPLCVSPSLSGMQMSFESPVCVEAQEEKRRKRRKSKTVEGTLSCMEVAGLPKTSVVLFERANVAGQNFETADRQGGVSSTPESSYCREVRQTQKAKGRKKQRLLKVAVGKLPCMEEPGLSERPIASSECANTAGKKCDVDERQGGASAVCFTPNAASKRAFMCSQELQRSPDLSLPWNESQVCTNLLPCCKPVEVASKDDHVTTDPKSLGTSKKPKQIRKKNAGRQIFQECCNAVDLQRQSGMVDPFMGELPILTDQGRAHYVSMAATSDALDLATQRNSQCQEQEHWQWTNEGALVDLQRGTPQRLEPSLIYADGIQAYSDVKFVKDWQQYCPYPPSSLNIRHTYYEGEPQLSSLPLFGSSRATACMDSKLADYYDVIINAGGPLWALDWCPQKEEWQHLQGCRKEYLAVGVHPHDSPLHRLGEPVDGKGIIQVWAFSVADVQVQVCEVNLSKGQGKRNTKSVPAQRSNLGSRNKQEVKLATDIQCNVVDDVMTHDLNSRKLDHILMATKGHDLQTDRGARKGGELGTESQSPTLNIGNLRNFKLPEMVLGLAHDGGLTWDAKWQPAKFSLDLNSRELCRLGYLAVLFGDGSVQVFDVPLPTVVENLKAFDRLSGKPVVVYLNPIFRCAGLPAGGGRKSMPLVLEWSSPPHDRLLVGCHDGVVALWKFAPEPSTEQDTRPLMCFVADSAPIRALSWAQDGCEEESNSVVATASHSGYLKFWDLRDPFYPLWDQVIAKGVCISSLDWVSNPNYIVLSLDDGSIRLFNMDAAASDTPLTGEPCTKTLTNGLYSFYSSADAIWTAQVSRATGILVYGGEDGSIVQFQLSEQALANERQRAKAPHFVFGQFRDHGEMLSIISPNSVCPVRLKKHRNETRQTPLAKVLFESKCNSLIDDEEKGVRLKPPRARAKQAVKRKGHIEEMPTVSDSLEDSSLGLLTYSHHSSAEAGYPSGIFSADDDQFNGRKDGYDGEVGDPSTNDKVEGNSSEDWRGSMPSKLVAIHRVRWNPNKGWENLVCFGGAAGILRCQLVYPKV